MDKRPYGLKTYWTKDPEIKDLKYINPKTKDLMYKGPNGQRT